LTEYIKSVENNLKYAKNLAQKDLTKYKDLVNNINP